MNQYETLLYNDYELSLITLIYSNISDDFICHATSSSKQMTNSWRPISNQSVGFNPQRPILCVIVFHGDLIGTVEHGDLMRFGDLAMNGC